MISRMSDKLQNLFECLRHGFIAKLWDNKFWGSGHCVQLDAKVVQDETSQRFHDLDDLAGSWVADEAFDDAVKAFDFIGQPTIR